MVNLKKTGVDLFKYKSSVNKALNSFSYTLKAGKVSSVQSK